MKKLLFIYNLHAGKSKIKGHVANILDLFVKAGYRPEVHVTQGIGEAAYVVGKRGAGYDRIICSGGDGTLNEVINGLMKLAPERRPTLGYIPAGTTNDFAKSLALPLNPMKAAQVALTGDLFPIDIGTINGEYFSYVCGFGAFTEVSYATPQEMKKVLGHPAYLLEGVKSLMDLKPHRVKVEWNGGIIEEDLLLGVVTNSYSVAGFKGFWGEDILLDEGEFEVTLVRQPENMVGWTELMGALISRSGKTEAVIHFKAKEIRFTSAEQINWVRDGEFAGSLEEVTVKNLHKAITIVKND